MKHLITIALFLLASGAVRAQFTYSVPTTPPNFTFNVSANTQMFQANNLGTGNHTLVMASLGRTSFWIIYW